MTTHRHASWTALRAERDHEPGARDAAEHSRRAIALGEQIRRLRRRQGLSQAELAARARTSQAAIARLELGDVDPRLSTLDRLSKALGTQLVVELREPAPVP